MEAKRFFVTPSKILIYAKKRENETADFVSPKDSWLISKLLQKYRKKILMRFNKRLEKQNVELQWSVLMHSITNPKRSHLIQYIYKLNRKPQI